MWTLINPLPPPLSLAPPPPSFPSSPPSSPCLRPPPPLSSYAISAEMSHVDLSAHLGLARSPSARRSSQPYERDDGSPRATERRPSEP